jgi:outer membrane protein assembly factor BamE (lipoprotein component of BamABCDE complex)
MTAGQLFVSRVAAQEVLSSTAESALQDHLLPPRVDRIGVRASRLHWGMRSADVGLIMGAPAEVQAYSGPSGNVRVLDYPTEPIATKVSICEGQVCAVRLDVGGSNDRALPAYSRSVWLGMDRGSVLRVLGAPAEVRSFVRYDMHLEDMVFERPGQSDVAVLFIGNRVATKRIEKRLAPDILRVALPSSGDPTGEETDAQGGDRAEPQVRIGMVRSQVQALFGAPKMLVNSTFKSRPVAYAVYQTDASGAFGSFTFIDGVLTEFASGDRMPLSKALNGG